MDYGYNKVHDRTYERFGASGSAGDAFEYDKARRLTKAWMGSSTPASPSGNTYVQTIVYNMDDDGNRSSVVVTPYGVSPTTTSYSANNLNQYTAVGGTSQSHDANGNLTNNGTLTFKYNYKNLITEVRQSSGGALVAEYLYDANGRRVVKNVNGGIFERYIYADVETISVLNGLQAWKQDFVFDVTGIDQILMLEQADVLDQDSDLNTTELTRSYYHRNALGSVMGISTASQTEAASYRYTPYGERTTTRGGSVQSIDPLGQYWGFTARFHDDDLAAVYFRARHQAPGAGRFTQRDPMGHEAGPNQYQFVESSPLSRRDPMGLFSVSVSPPRTALLDVMVGHVIALGKIPDVSRCDCGETVLEVHIDEAKVISGNAVINAYDWAVGGAAASAITSMLAEFALSRGVPFDHPGSVAALSIPLQEKACPEEGVYHYCESGAFYWPINFSAAGEVTGVPGGPWMFSVRVRGRLYYRWTWLKLGDPPEGERCVVYSKVV